MGFQVNDVMYTTLGVLGFTGTLPERIYKHLGSLGHLQLSMSDRLSHVGGFKNYWRLVLEEGPSLALTFTSDTYGTGGDLGLNPENFDDRITFTRASTGTYFDAAGVLQTAAVDERRRDYDPVTLLPRGLLVEEQRTNLLLRSSEFDNVYWTKAGSSITQDDVIAPDGTLTADLVVESATTSEHIVVRSPAVTSGMSYAVSCFMRQGSARYGLIRWQAEPSTTFKNAIFDLQLGTISIADSGVTATIEYYGDGWYRCSSSGVKGTGSASLAIGISDGANSTYLGDGTSGIYIWGAQLEAGSFPTSYIPTTTAQVTRAADIASVNTLSPWYNAVEGTIVVEAEPYARAAGFPPYYEMVGDYHIYKSMAANRVSGNGRGNTDISGVASATPSAKVATAYTDADIQSAVNGVLGTLTSVPRSASTTALRIGSKVAGGTSYINGHIRSINYYPKRLSNAELQALTV